MELHDSHARVKLCIILWVQAHSVSTLLLLRFQFAR